MIPDQKLQIDNKKLNPVHYPEMNFIYAVFITGLIFIVFRFILDYSRVVVTFPEQEFIIPYGRIFLFFAINNLFFALFYFLLHYFLRWKQNVYISIFQAFCFICSALIFLSSHYQMVVESINMYVTENNGEVPYQSSYDIILASPLGTIFVLLYLVGLLLFPLNLIVSYEQKK